MDSIGVHIAFRAGFRWPLRAGDTVELWKGMTKLGTITADLVLHLIGHHYATVRMQEQMRAELAGHYRLETPEAELLRAPLGKSSPVSREQMEMRRAARRRHRKSG